MPTLRQLQAFMAVMETGSISRAADMMLLSQPAVTKLVQSLEAEAGLHLFTRHKQRLTPTAEAHLYLNEAENLFQNLTRLERLAQDLKTMVLSNLTVAAYPAFGISLLPRILNGFQEKHEGSTSTLLIRSSPKVGELAIAQQFDLGFSMLPVLHQDVVSMPIFRTSLVVIVPPDHRLASRDEVGPEDLRDERFISMGYDDHSMFVVDEYFRQAEVSRVIVGRVALSAAICEFVREGTGISIIDPMTAGGAMAVGLKSVRLKPAIHFDTHLLIPKRRPASKVNDRFLVHLREYFHTGSPNIKSLRWAPPQP